MDAAGRGPRRSPEEKFEVFFEEFPARNGVKARRGDALESWLKMPAAEQKAAFFGALAYRREVDAGREQKVMHAVTFLRSGVYKDWAAAIEPPPPPKDSSTPKTPLEEGRGPVREWRGPLSPEPGCEHATPMCGECRRANLIRLRREIAQRVGA